MAKIKWIGFDMDHTLAQYNQTRFERIAFKAALEKFIEIGYPPELAKLEYNPSFLIRGLLVDVKRGNLLKVDCHKYVKTAFHGHKKLTKEQRDQLYNQQSFKAESFKTVDTFFALSEMQMYAEIIDYMNRHPGVIRKSFEEVYLDVKNCIDKSHSDGSIKHLVLLQPKLYIDKDKELSATLKKLREAGKKIFLLTNSLWDYTDAIMKHLLPKEKGITNWRDFFDLVIVGGNKPNFFSGRQPFYKVLTDSGSLRVTHGQLNPSDVYHGGNAHSLEKFLRVKGDEIAYVGDHIYGDIFHSKDKFNWRTILIIQELEHELKSLNALKKNLADIRKFSLEREQLEEEHHQLAMAFSHSQNRTTLQKNENPYKVRSRSLKQIKFRQKIEFYELKIASCHEKIKTLMEKRSQTFHPLWGELLRTGMERSRFADQITEYACLYTSKVTNLLFYSPFKKFESHKERLPHEI